MYCFIERLSLFNWFFRIFPLVLRKKIKWVFVVDGNSFSLKISRKIADFFKIKLEKLQFRLVDIKDEEGLLLRLRIPCQDLAKIQQEIFIQYSFDQLERNGKNRLPTFIYRNIGKVSLSVGLTLYRAMLLVQICHWKMKMSLHRDSCILFLDHRPWFRCIQKYSQKYKVEIIPLLPRIYFEFKRPWLKAVYFWTRWLQRSLVYSLFRPSKKIKNKEIVRHSPKLGLEYYGQFNLKNPEFYSDFFFLQASSFSAQDLVTFFHLPAFPLDKEKWEDLNRMGIQPILLDPRIRGIPNVPCLKPLFRFHSPKVNLPRFLLDPLNHMERQWLKSTLQDYESQKKHWLYVFSNSNVRLYLSWFKFEATHCAIADALRELGGVMAIYQRALDTTPFVESQMDTDIVFGYSNFVANVERENGSRIPYFVITGYLGDHRFEPLKEKASLLRAKLMKKEVRKIIAYMDEGSSPDARWHTGHEFMQVNYEFLLQKVLDHPWLGLILKPKLPATLRQRLGRVSELLEAAIATGRCYLYEGGNHHSGYPPAIAALSADVAVHGHLCAATAGMECALAGIPTLLMDREGWGISPLYDLGIGKVVFKDWDSLWEACLENWKGSQGVPGFGDWSPFLDQLDPFRDGRAAERMGTYLKWMMEDFKAGCDRKTVMANAAERYSKMWGSDKVLSIHCRPC